MRKKVLLFLCIMMLLAMACREVPGQDQPADGAVSVDIDINEVSAGENSGEEESADTDRPDTRPAKDMEAVLVDGCAYVYQMKMYDENNPEDFTLVYAPLGAMSGPDKAVTTDGFSTYFYDYGLDFHIYTHGIWDENQEKEWDEWCKAMMELWAKGNSSYWEKNPDSYRNLIRNETKMLDGGNAFVKYIGAERIFEGDYPAPVHKIQYYAKDENGFLYTWELNIDHWMAQAETAKVLAELSECYDIDLNQYAPDPDHLTQAGMWMEGEQDIYTPAEGQPQFHKMNGYHYMGISEMSITDDGVTSTVMAPLGRAFFLYETGISSDLHGVYFMLDGSWSKFGYEFGEGRVVSSAESWCDAVLSGVMTDDFRNPEKGELIKIDGDEVCYIGTTCEKRLYGTERFYPFHNIECAKMLDGDRFITIILALDTAYYDIHTNEVLSDIEKAYHLDLSEYYYD